jgi:hypothetical protein
MSSIMPHYRTVQLLSNQQFAIDEFQREYKWERKQVDELLDDLQGKFAASHKTGDEPRKVAQYEEYFLGSIIVSKRDGKNYLIDGQQRVTSLTLLLIFLYREAESKELPPAILQTLAPLITVTISDSLASTSVYRNDGRFLNLCSMQNPSTQKAVMNPCGTCSHGITTLSRATLFPHWALLCQISSIGC